MGPIFWFLTVFPTSGPSCTTLVFPWFAKGDAWESNSKNQRLTHVSGPGIRSCRNFDVKIRHILHLLKPLWCKQMRTNKYVCRILSVDPCCAQLFQSNICSSHRRRIPNIGTLPDVIDPKSSAFVVSTLHIVSTIKPISRGERFNIWIGRRMNPFKEEG